MENEIVRIRRKDISKLDAENFPDIEDVEKGLIEGTIVYAAFCGGQPAGIVTLEPVGSIYRTSYFYIAEKYRNRGLGRELMEAIRIYDPRIYIDDEMKGYETMLSAFVHMGVEQIREVKVYSFERNKETLMACMDMMQEKGLDVMEMLRRHGYAAAKLKMIRSSVIEELGNEIGEGYDEDKNPFNVKGLDREWSYIVTKNRFPAAFIACVKKKDILRVEQLCAHKDYMRYGAAMLAMLSVIERVLVDSSIRCVQTAVTKENKDMIRLIEDKFSDFIKDIRSAKVYALK